MGVCYNNTRGRTQANKHTCWTNGEIEGHDGILVATQYNVTADTNLEELLYMTRTTHHGI